KVIHAYDAAAIDYRQWLKWKTKGIYLISREKANSRKRRPGLLPMLRDLNRHFSFAWPTTSWSSSSAVSNGKKTCVTKRALPNVKSALSK
ncbi:MAG: hypothetical protein ACC742_11160, partial [Thermoanaerobaculales bacterium]